MKVSKLVEALSDVLDMDKKKKKKAGLRRILAKLKKKENTPKKVLASASGGKEKKHLQSALKVSRAQRKKGIKELRKLKGKVS